MPFADAARSAKLKLSAVMASVEAAHAEALSKRIRVATRAEVDTSLVRKIEEGVVRGRVLDLVYEDRFGNETKRAVEAHGLFSSHHGWYLIGWCRMRDGGRVFRLDRIRDAQLTDEAIPDRDVDEVLDAPFPVLVPSLVE
jgi:predicted DNA-binding transcriptional regulator YafY